MHLVKYPSLRPCRTRGFGQLLCHPTDRYAHPAFIGLSRLTTLRPLLRTPRWSSLLLNC